MIGKRFGVAARAFKLFRVFCRSAGASSVLGSQGRKLPRKQEGGCVMTGIERNGMSGLVLRVTMIALAAVMFGCAPKAPPAEADATASFVVAGR